VAAGASGRRARRVIEATVSRNVWRGCSPVAARATHRLAWRLLRWQIDSDLGSITGTARDCFRTGARAGGRSRGRLLFLINGRRVDERNGSKGIVRSAVGGVSFATAPTVRARDSFNREQRWQWSTTASGRRNRPLPLLEPWPRNRQAAPLVTIPLVAASVSRCVLSGVNRGALQALPRRWRRGCPGTPVRTKARPVRRSASLTDNRRRSGLEIGD